MNVFITCGLSPSLGKTLYRFMSLIVLSGELFELLPVLQGPGNGLCAMAVTHVGQL